MSEVDVGDMVVEVEPFHQHSIKFCCCVKDSSREAVWQIDVWPGSANEPGVWYWTPARGRTYTHWHSWCLIECKQWILEQWGSRWCFSSSNSNVKNKTFFLTMHSCHTIKWRVSWWACLCELVDYDQAAMYGAVYCLQCFGGNGDNVAISQNLHQVCPANSHKEQKGPCM